jgi:XTP/dITP diphosphohydrolase
MSGAAGERSKQRIVVATTNPNKVREIAQVLAPLGFEVLGLHQLGRDLPEPIEDAATFEGNARIKARAYAQALGLPCLAEDSGLEVDALGGAPGVHSARYAGIGATREERDLENNRKLLRELAATGAGDRRARFVCAMCLVAADGEPLFETRATYEGTIAFEARGENGFGYDPLLLLPELERTSAELSPQEKNARSHRGQAARALAAYLARRAGSPGAAGR